MKIGFLEFSLVTEDKNILLSTYVASIAVFASFFAFLLIPSHYLSKRFSSTYRQGAANPVAWLSYCLSQFHAPISGLLSLYCILNSEPGENYNNWYFGTTEIQVFTLLFTLSFMVVDTCMILYAPSQFRDLKALLIHHFTIFLVYSIGMLWTPAIATYFMLNFQVQELTNPFLTNRWFLLECKMGSSPFYIINGVILIISFFIIRVVYGVVVCYRLVSTRPDWMFGMPALVAAYYGALFFQFLQFYWFFFIIRATLSYFTKQKHL